MTEFPRGCFVWHELMSTDPAAAERFYSELIGWTTKKGDLQDIPYIEWVNRGTSLGGLLPLPDEAKAQGAPPHWLAYVAVPSTDETLERARGLGAKTLAGPLDIPTVGRIAVLQDPQGAVIALHTPSGDLPAPDGDGLGRFSWNELAAANVATAFEFYASLFGWVKGEAVDMGADGTYQMYGRSGEPPLGGMYGKSAQDPTPQAYWLCYVTVDDVHRKVERVTALGGRVLNGPMEVPGGDWVAQCLDPQGAAFALHSRKPSEG